MSNLQSLKSRIKNIKSTAKVTKAMKLIAANKFKKSLKELENFRSTKTVIDKIFSSIACKDNIETLSSEYQKLFKKNDKPKSVMLILISSNKGLCGSFNSNLFNVIENEITLLLNTNCNISVINIGNKAYSYFNSSHADFLHSSYPNIQKCEVENANTAIEIAIKQFLDGEIDECRIYYNQYISSISHPVKCESLLPIYIKKSSYEYSVLYEGDNLFEKLIKKFLSAKIVDSLLQSKAGEEASRMMAMDGATNNAIKISDRLTLKYNRTRQAVITSEISEIISGSEAL